MSSLEARATARAFFRELRRLQEHWRVLEHPFMRRWSDGRVSTHEVRHFAAQYGLAAGALAERATGVASVVPTVWRDALDEYAAEKVTQLAIWHAALDELGVERPTVPTGETRWCVSSWSPMPGDGSVVGLTVLFALESAHTEAAEGLLNGLARRSLAVAPSLIAYWQWHVHSGRAHVGALRCLIGQLADATTQDPALTAAEAALAAWWDLLSGIDRPAHASQDGDGVTRGALFDAPADWLSRLRSS